MKFYLLLFFLSGTELVFSQKPLDWDSLESWTETFLNEVNINSSSQSISIEDDELIIETIMHDFDFKVVYNTRQIVDLADISNIEVSDYAETNYTQILFLSGDEKSILETSFENTQIIKKKSTEIIINKISKKNLQLLVSFLKSFKNNQKHSQ